MFRHVSELGCAPSYKLFDAVSVAKHDDVEAPRSFADYGDVTVDEDAIPEGIEVIRMV